MKRIRIVKIASIAAVSLAALVLTSEVAAAQNIQGVINGRSGSSMTLQTQDSGNVVVILTPATEVDEVEGVFKARKKEMAVTAPH
jgi:hypothetical protein